MHTTQKGKIMSKEKDARFSQCEISAQWKAFDKVLHWINEQEEKYISKGALYDAVMDMRPDPIQLSNETSI